MARERYRWLTAEGEPCSPLHRAPGSALRWLARQRRAYPAALLVCEETTAVTRRARRRPIIAAERELLVRADLPVRRLPDESHRWLLRQLRRWEEERRRRIPLRRLTAQLTRVGGA